MREAILAALDAHGAYLGRFVCDLGSPIYRSATSTIYVATDLRGEWEGQVVLKIVASVEQFDNEVHARGQGSLHEDHVAALLHHEREHLTLVLARGERSLFDMVAREQWAGRELRAIMQWRAHRREECRRPSQCFAL